MNAAELHDQAIVIDGLICAKWNRELFEDMAKGKLTAANCTVSVWENFEGTKPTAIYSQKFTQPKTFFVRKKKGRLGS